MTAPVKCMACAWESGQRSQDKLMDDLAKQGIYRSLPSTYQVLGPKPEHICDRDLSPIGDAEIRAVLKIYNGFPDAATIGEIRRACEAKIKEMRHD